MVNPLVYQVSFIFIFHSSLIKVASWHGVTCFVGVWYFTLCLVCVYAACPQGTTFESP